MTDQFAPSQGATAVRLAERNNKSLPFRVGTFDTLTEGLDYAARGETGYNFFSGRGQPLAALTYRELRARARDLASRLVALGIAPGSRLAIIAETTPDFMVFFYGCQYAGLVPAPLPLSLNVGGHKTYVTRLRGMLSSARVAAAVGSKELIGMLREAGEGLGIGLIGTPEDFAALPGGGGLRPFGKDDPCYIQYSSGSTTEPRGILVTQEAITANARAIGRDGLRLTEADRATSWLPLYHDMGLVGFCITPLLAQVTVDYLATATFALRPRLWLKLLSDFQSTISFSPTFGYELCVRRAGRDGGGGFALEAWRVAGVGGEMVRPEVLAQFAALFQASGFDARAFLPSYGLAEATLAVSFPPLGAGVRVDWIERDAYENRAEAVPGAPADVGQGRTRAFTRCGQPLPGYAIAIRGDDDRVLPERAIGRVLVRGPSLMREYFNNPDKTREALLPDGWLDTGDMGYLVEGELVITGRRKDMIICNGRNIWPQDIEWSVEHLENVRTNSAAAFSVEGGEDGERVVIAVECYVADEDGRRALERDIVATVHKTAGVPCDVLLVPPRSLPYTSSGKLSRAGAKALFTQGKLPTLGVAMPAGAPRAAAGP